MNAQALTCQQSITAAEPASRPAPSIETVLERLARFMESRPIAERSEPFTIDELAKRWHCEAKTVERLCSDGTLASFKIGRRRLVRPIAVVRYEEQQSKGGVL